MKEKKPDATVDGLIAGFPAKTQDILKKVRALIRKELPEARECVAYGLASYEYARGKYVVHFSGFKNHIGLFPTPSGVIAFKKDLADYVHSKGSIQFPLDEPVPYGLIRKIVKFRLKELRRKYPEAK